MKRILLLILSLSVTLFAAAQTERTYTDDLVVSIDGESTEPQKTTVTVVDNNDGTIDFRLNNFSLVSGENVMPVGNIVLSDLPVAWNQDGIREFAFNDSIVITAGSDPSVPAEGWLGPMLGSVPLAMKGRMTEDKLYVTIDIDMMESIKQIIKVVLGDNNFTPAGISGVVGQDGKSPVYDLQGRRVLRPTQGIYVVNGRKVMVK